MAGRCLVCLQPQMREIARLLPILHTQRLNIPRAALMAAIAGSACADDDPELFRVYLDLVLISLARHAPEAFEARMNSLGDEYQRYFAGRYYGQGKAEGKADGRMEIILELLALRFGPLS
jgi:hypothetical protein